MHNDERKRLYEKTEIKMDQLPWYAKEYIIRNLRKRSPNTLLGYCSDYISFLDWLSSEGFYNGTRLDCPLSTLESLRVDDVERYKDFLSIKHENSLDTIARKIASLKSLFQYLSVLSEDENGYPYIKRNVMVKIETEKEKITVMAKADRIKDKILRDEEIFEFREFIAEGFQIVCKDNKRILNSHLKNKDRDLAFVSLILGSGLRVSEALSLDLPDIDWLKGKVLVNRKGNKKDSVPVSNIALDDLKSYLAFRQTNYGVDDKQEAIFLSLPTGPHGKVSRLTVRASQKMLDRYVSSFGKPALTIHKLRHTFATKYHKENKDLASLKDQLGHSDLNTTMIYTHVGEEERRESVNRADSLNR
ncbi:MULTISPECIES: tyrosine recombinase XerS [unclassified Paenibacillus]|uniref:tyrosine recombinase XerS n=1 Tax=unclassified Paenibacillus TaxID=185978 RepID=UPI0008C27326|nr:MULTISPECIES: tyrosine recombinase XerS [unclassified Paenibacillus]QLG39924.1 tyrosine recombinase XerS [Paenibacillus sp. E222]SEN92103.1 Site-specific recombinase XerD [Paenibacillus sp. OK076]